MKKYIVYIQSVFLVSSIIGLYIFAIHRNAQKPISEIEVIFTESTPSFLDVKSVYKILQKNVNLRVGKRKYFVNLLNIESRFLSNPYVEKVAISLSLSGKLSVVIQQKKPIVRIVGKSGFYLDEKGMEIPLSSNYSDRVPLAKGFDLRKDKEQLITLIKKINRDVFLRKMIVTVEKEKKSYVLKTRLYGHKVYLGDWERLDKKLKKMKGFYIKTIKDKTANKYHKIYLGYRNQVVCTKR